MERPEKLHHETHGLKEAEKIILRWDSSSSDEARDRMIFEGDRQEVDRYLSAVDLICNSMQNSSLSESRDPVRLAMARLEDEFRNILISHSAPPEPDMLYLSSYPMSEEDPDEESEEPEELTSPPPPSPLAANIARKGSGLTKMGSSGSDSLRDRDLIPAEAIGDLSSVAARMVAAGYTRECIQAYSSIRKPILDSTFGRLGIERLSIGDVQRLDWPTVESLINRWIRASRACIRVLFAAERRLCDQIFPPDGGAGDACFAEATRSAASRLFGFADAISISRRSPEKLFKILDLHDAVTDLLPDVEAVFQPKTTESIRVQAAEIQTRLGEAARGMLTEFENAIQRETSKIPVPGGTIHPLTRYVMNYISLICDYAQTLTTLINQRPKLDSNSEADPSNPLLLNGNEEDGEGESSPLSSHLVFIATILETNLEKKAKLYKDPSLAHLFMMNNLHYIVQKAKGSPELRQMIGDAWLRRHTGRVRQHATGYQRATWLTILGWLRDEGIHVGGGFSSGVSKSALKERFKGFNAAFEDAHRTQAGWQVPDAQLREELRISISEKLLPAYRAFLGRFRHHLEGGRHSDGYIKYSVEDLEAALGDFFEGSPGSGHHSRRKSQG